MEMRSDGTCSILNDDCPEKKITDCRDCQLHGGVEDYRNRTYRMQEEKKYCSTCNWYAVNEGVCCNGESEYRADFRDLDNSCEKWEEIR